MLIHPWDAALDTAEWQEWLASTDRFGMLAVNNLDPAQAPLVLPTHFTVAGDELLIHLARPNPVWPHLEAAAEVRLAVIGDYAYIPTYWRAKAGGPDEDGVPTSYYAAVQFVCRPTVVDDPQGKAEILTAQLADFQPEGGHAAVAVDDGALRADAVRHPRRPPDGAAGGCQVQVRRRQSRRAPPTRHRQSRAARPRARPGPPRSSGGDWPRSATGGPATNRSKTTRSWEPRVRLAVLIGVNLGPDLHRLPGTIPWRLNLHQHNHNTHMAKFTRLGLSPGRSRSSPQWWRYGPRFRC